MRVLMLLSFLFLFNELRAQDNESNIYKVCFLRYINEYHKENTETIYLKGVTGITEYLPFSVLGVKIVHLNDEEIKNRARKSNFVLTQVFPILISSDVISLDIREFSITRRRGIQKYVNHGGSSFKIGYVNGQYMIVDEIHRGL